MELTIQVQSKDDPLLQELVNILEDRVLERLKKANSNYGKRTKPYTVTEFASETNKNIRTVYREIEAGMYDMAQDYKPYLIKAHEAERFTK